MWSSGRKSAGGVERVGRADLDVAVDAIGAERADRVAVAVEADDVPVAALRRRAPTARRVRGFAAVGERDDRPAAERLEQRRERGRDRQRRDRRDGCRRRRRRASSSAPSPALVAERDRAHRDAQRRGLLGVEAEVGQVVVVGPDAVADLAAVADRLDRDRARPCRAASPCRARTRGGSRRSAADSRATSRTISSRVSGRACRAAARAGSGRVRPRRARRASGAGYGAVCAGDAHRRGRGRFEQHRIVGGGPAHRHDVAGRAPRAASTMPTGATSTISWRSSMPGAARSAREPRSSSPPTVGSATSTRCASRS